MKDLEVILENIPGTLSLLGETLGKHNISLEGGGVFYNGSYSIAKTSSGYPGTTWTLLQKIADGQVNILTQYSDHANQLILVVDNYQKGEEISKEWMKEWWS